MNKQIVLSNCHSVHVCNDLGDHQSAETIQSKRNQNIEEATAENYYTEAQRWHNHGKMATGYLTI